MKFTLFGIFVITTGKDAIEKAKLDPEQEAAQRMGITLDEYRIFQRKQSEESRIRWQEYESGVPSSKEGRSIYFSRYSFWEAPFALWESFIEWLLAYERRGLVWYSKEGVKLETRTIRIN